MNLFKLWGEIGVRNTGAIQAIDETTGAAQGAESKMSSAFKKIGAAVTTYFAVDKIVSFGKEIVNVAAEVSAEASAFEQIMGDYAAQASEKVMQIADATGMVNTRLTPYMTSMTAKFKGLGYDIDDATNLAQTGLTIAADAAAFWDKSLDDAMGSLNSFVNGNYEGGEAIGLFANETTLAAWASENLGFKWDELTEKEKQFARLQFAKAMQEASGATGQAAKESEQYANVQANLNEKWRQFKAQIGEPILQNVVLPAMEKLSGLVDQASTAFQNLSTWVKENQTAISNIATTVGVATRMFIAFKAAMLIQNAVRGFQAAQVALSLMSLEIGGANLAQAALNGTLSIGETIVGLLTGKIKLATVAQGLLAKGQAVLNAVMAANPIVLVVMAIAALVAAFVVLWNKSESFRNFWINLWNGIKSITGTVIEGIKSFFTGLWTHIQSVWDTIVNVVTVAVMLIGSIISGAFQIITLPWRFIWENCGEYIIAAWEWIKSTVSSAVNAVKDFIVNAWIAISTALSPILDTIKNVISTVWNAIKSTVSTVVNAVKSAVTTGFNTVKDAISTPLNAAKATVSTIFNAIKTTISNVINSAKNVVKSGLDAIKGFFDKLKIKFPNIKLPHFNIEGSFSLSPPSVPKLSIDWYAKGGVLNKPTLFDYNPKTGRAKVGGEAGAEAIAPIDTLLGYIRTAVKEENSGLNYYLEKLISMLAEYMPQLISGVNRQLVLDSGVLVGQLAPQMDSKLGDINELRKRGR